MAEQAWFTSDGTGLGSAPPPPPVVPVKSAYELRPLTTGELLDRTFYLYRSNFWLFVGVASIAAAVQVLAGLAQIIYMHYAGIGTGPFGQVKAGPGAMFQSLGIFAISMISSVLYLAVYGVTQAATTSAVAAIYLGDPTSMGKALSQVKGKWFRFVLISLWQIWSAMWVPLVGVIVASVAAAVPFKGSGASGAMAVGFLVIVVVMGGSVYGVIAYIRNSFAVPAAVMEGLKVRKAMKRSKKLTSGSKGRVFLLFVFVTVLYCVAGAIQSPIAIIVMQKKTTHVLLMLALNQFIGFFTGSVVGPVGAIGLCLFYIDQRIRKEGFDIEYMMERSGPVVDSPAAELP